MNVSITSALMRRLQGADIEPVAFCQQFERWKAQWPKYEYEFELFGKDAAYRTPQVSGRPDALRHVHLRPPPGSKDFSRWQDAFRFKRRKTSDRHLIYAQSRAEHYLLIAILDEPTAHAVAQMRTDGHRQAMRMFCDIADNFVHFGEIP